MAAGNIQEVGARFIMSDGAKFIATFDKATVSVKALNDQLARGADLSKAQASATADSTKMLLDNADASKVAAGASDGAAAATAKQVEATDALAASAKRTAGVQTAAADASAAAWTKTTVVAGKILKYASVATAAVLYEGIKNYNAFQQQITQSAIDAGVKKSQLPAFSKMALNVSNATGLAAVSVADMMYRLASANPAFGTTTKAMKEMVTQAGNLYVLAGNTGNYDQIARTYGAIVSNQMSLTQGSKPLTYNSAGGQAINEWALATTGGGDMKMGDLVSSLGTGILPLAKTFGISLNNVGAALDVLSPAMNASSAATRLKTAISMMAAPSTIGIQAAELFGGNAGTFGGVLRSKGMGGLLNYLHGMFGKQVTGSTFASAFYGGGLGSATGGTKGVGSGAGEYMRVHGFTAGQIGVMEQAGGASNFGKMTPAQLQAVGFSAGVTGKQAMATMETSLLSAMFGGGRTGAAVMQLVNERGTYATKNAEIGYKETHTAYESAMHMAYAEPMVKFNKFKTQFENFTIIVGKDVTPAFDGFLSDLEALGNWFGHNKGLLDSLGVAAGGLVAGAAFIKLLGVAGNAFRGVQSVLRVVTNPVSTIKAVFSGSSTTSQQTAADIQLRAAQMQLEAAGKGALVTGGTALEGDAGAAGATGWLAKGKFAVAGVASRIVPAGVIALATYAALNEANKNSTFKRLGAVQSNSLMGHIYARSDNIADTALHIASLGFFHPHLNVTDAISNSTLAAQWAGVNPSSMSKGQLSTLSNYWSSGEKGLSPSQRATVTAMGTGSLTKAHTTSTAQLQALAKQIEATGKLTNAATVQSQAAEEQHTATMLQLKAAQDLLAVAPALQAALSPGNIHALATAGLKTKAARSG